MAVQKALAVYGDTKRVDDWHEGEEARRHPVRGEGICVFSESRRSLKPEEQLLMGILQEAVRDLFSGDRRKFADAKLWFETREDGKPSLYSFEFICDILDLHADSVRKSLFWGH